MNPGPEDEHRYAQLMMGMYSANWTNTDPLTSAGEDIALGIKEERERLHRLKITQEANRVLFRSDLTAERRAFQVSRSLWEETEEVAESVYIPEDAILKLNLGGEGFITTTLKTLCKYPTSTLAAMFSGRHALVLHKDAVFIDRNFQPFARVVSFLRTGKRPLIEDLVEEQAFKEEMDYWGLALTTPLPPNLCTAPKLFEPRSSSAFLLFEDGYQTLRKTGVDHAVALLDMKLGEESEYVEFEVSLSDYEESSYQMFVGLVDKSALSGKYLVNYLWKQAPNSYFWDITDNQLIKTDSHCQASKTPDYSCLCEPDHCLFGFLYDWKHKTVSFYKNGINQGQAFTAVETGLTPAVDLWFDEGVVKLTQTLRPESRRQTISS